MLVALSRAATSTEIGVQQLTEEIENDDLVVAYQPLIDIRSRGIVGGEALARWSQRRGIAIPPDQLIRLAEENGPLRGGANRTLATGQAESPYGQQSASRGS